MVSQADAKLKTLSTAAQSCCVASFSVVPSWRSALQPGCLYRRLHGWCVQRIAAAGFHGVLGRAQIGLQQVPLRLSHPTPSAASLASLRYAVYGLPRADAAQAASERSRTRSNYRMERSGWDKVPVEATVAGRSSWC